MVTNDELVKKIAKKNDIQVIDRPKYMQDPNVRLEEVLKYALLRIEEFDDFPEAIVYINYLYPFRPTNLIDELIVELQYKGLDSVFSSFVDYGNYWEEDANGTLGKIGILPLDNLLYSLRLDKETPNEIILSAIKTFEKNKNNV